MKSLVAAGALAGLLAGSAMAQPLSFDSGADQILMYRKIQCSTKDLVPVVYHWSGRVWSRVPGEPDRLLWNVEGMNIRTCVTVDDPKRGKGVRMVSRELMLYLDPKTGAVLDSWTNPWTGKTNRIFHVANDPVNQRPVFPLDSDGKPFRMPLRVEQGRVFWNIEVPLFYTNPLGGDYQDYAGNQYHAMEIFDFIVDERKLRDPKLSNAGAAVAWVRLSGWMPFMEMGSRPGSLVFNATGQVVPGVDALPAVLREQIARTYPAYREPPPADDTRPNATTWTEFRKFVDQQRTRAGQ